jgi:hypothetical protein
VEREATMGALPTARYRVSESFRLLRVRRAVADEDANQKPSRTLQNAHDALLYLRFTPQTPHVSPTSRAPLRKSVWPSRSKGNAVKKSARL